MNRSRMTRVVAATCLVLGALGFSASGCVEAEGRFFVDQFCPLNEEGDEVDCNDDTYVPGFAVPADCVGDSCFAEGGLVFLQVRNEMVSSLKFKQNYNNIETSTIILTGYDVRVNTGAEETEYAYNYSGQVAPDGGKTEMVVQLIPLGKEAADLLGTVPDEGSAGWAGIRVYGRTTGGIEVETPEVFVPINFF